MTRHVMPGPIGAWLAVAGERGVLLVAATPSAAAGSAGSLHAALSGTDPEQAILDLLAGDGVSATPDFALVTVDGRGRPGHAIVRGAVVVRVADAAVTAAGARTWLERDLDAPDAVVLEAPDVAGDAVALPLESGAAWATRIAWSATDGSAPVVHSPVAAAVEPDLVPAPDAVPPSDVAPTPDVAPPPRGPASASTPEPAPASESAPATASTEVVEHTIVEPEEGVGYDHLFEATIVRSVEDAAVRPQVADEDEAPVSPPAPPTGAEVPGSSDLSASDSAGPEAPGHGAGPTAGSDAGSDAGPAAVGFGTAHDAGDSDDGDHDGETVLSGSIPGRAERPRAAADEVAAPPAVRGFVLVLPDDRREPISGELVLGRAPTARVSEGRVPRLVTLAGDPDISRSHLRVALEGDTVVVTDLHSRNGTSVVLPGKPPQLLRAGEPAAVIPGTVLDLGGESRLRVEEAPGA